MKRIQWYGPTLLLLITVVVVLVAGPQVARNIQWQQTDANISLIRGDLTNSQFLAELSDAFRKVAVAVEPSVVYVQVLARPVVEMSPQQSQFRRYDAYVQVGSGSGWVYDTNGHIVTNEHVIRNGERIRVRFSNGAEYDARVLNSDRKTDIAVLKVDGDDLHPAAIATEQPEQGDIVFAFGSPFHFDFSMSQGIVSGQGRTLGWLERGGGYEDFIQTDAAINPGNSGGPLTNIRGEVVGMNSAIASRDGDYDGVGFAIPVYMVRHVVDQLIKDGRVSRGFLGVRLPDQDLDASMAKAFGYDGRGVVVQDLTPDGPAGAAGVMAGDIIVSIEDEPTETIAELRFLVSSYPPGHEIKIEVFRDGKTEVLKVTLGELPTMGMNRERVPGVGDEVDPSLGLKDGEPLTMRELRRLGIEELRDLSPEIREALGEAVEGVLIEKIRRMSIAAAAGLREGMIITRINGDAVGDLETFSELISDFESGDTIRFRVAMFHPIERRMVQQFIALDVP